MIWVPALMTLGGLVLLAVAADRFVLAAARLSRLWGLSPVLVGALVVGMGTSAPELLVSASAARHGQLDLALGNAVGSNVANVTLVLGATALLMPVWGNLAILRREGLVMLAAVTAFALTLVDLRLSRLEGILLAAGMVVAGILIVRWAKQDRGNDNQAPDTGDDPPPNVSQTRELLLGLTSLGLTLVGAEMLVRGGVELAEVMGVSSAFIGMTVVAVGTSVPELATSIAGIRRQEHDLVLGNVLGSNLFNALAVAGLAGILSPGTVAESFRVGSVAMVVCAALAGFLAFTGAKLVRWEGLLLLIGFGTFIWLTY